MEDNNMTEYHQLEDYYVRRLIKVTADIGYNYISWQDPIDNGVVVSRSAVIRTSYRQSNLVSESPRAL